MTDRVKLYKQPQGVPFCISLDMYTNVNQQEQSAESLPNVHEAQAAKASYSSEMIQSTWNQIRDCGGPCRGEVEFYMQCIYT